MFIVSKRELEKLANGEISVDDLAIPKNEALITWSGEDISEIANERGEKIELKNVLQDVKKRLENCDCSMCVEDAFSCTLQKKIVESVISKVK